MAKTAKSKQCVVLSRNSKERMEKSTSNSLVVYVSHKAWLKSVIEGNHGRVETTINYRNKDEEEDFSAYEFEDDILYLRSLDPKHWKEQDHYAVLGIKNLRHRANEDVIKRAYKHKILRHHPDKRKAMGEEIRSDDDYFTCITKAWETLGNPGKRRSYDSIDPYFSDNLPDEKEVKENFYVILGKAFKDNSRWSIKSHVPQLGDSNTPREQVEKFYMFWYDFESWREYSYQDEEDKESGQDREMRKWIEKKNKPVRLKKKKEEMVRIRTLVDMAYSLDPRIRMFQQQDKDRKQAAKRAKQEAAKARQLEEERLVREAAEKERLEKEKREAEERAKAEVLKQEREVQKKALRRERKNFRDLCKEQSYFAESSEESIRHMENVEKMCELFKLAQLEESIKNLRSEGKTAFMKIMDEIDRRIETERRAALLQSDMKSSENKQVKGHMMPWSEGDLQLLIKAVNLFPAGTNQRWEVVANFINQHSNSSGSMKRDAKEVLAKAKDLQSTDYSKSSLKEQANKKAYDNFIAEKKHKDVDERMPAFTERLENPLPNGKPHILADKLKDIDTADKKEAPPPSAPWTPVEQKLLEQALKTYPVSVPDRWVQISACLPSRTRKECMRRYKELVELVKAKKAAQVQK